MRIVHSIPCKAKLMFLLKEKNRSVSTKVIQRSSFTLNMALMRINLNTYVIHQFWYSKLANDFKIHFYFLAALFVCSKPIDLNDSCGVWDVSCLSYLVSSKISSQNLSSQNKWWSNIKLSNDQWTQFIRTVLNLH